MFEGWPTPSPWPSAPTPPPKPRKPDAKDFANLFDAAEVFNSSNLLPPDPLFKHLFHLSQYEAPMEHNGKPAPLQPTWLNFIAGLLRDLLLCERRLYWSLERIFWFCLLGGQHVKRDVPKMAFEERSVHTMIAHEHDQAVKNLESEKEQLVNDITKLQKKNAKTVHLLETEKDHAKRIADLLNEEKKMRDVEKTELNKRHLETVANIREEHDSQLNTLISTQAAKVEQERKRQKVAEMERQEQHRLAETRAEASQAEVEQLRRESAELREKVASIREEHDSQFNTLKSTQFAEVELERKRQKAVKTKLQEQHRLAESRAEASQAEVEQLRRKSVELHKKLASIREKHDGRITDLKSAQLAELEQERKKYDAAQNEQNKLLANLKQRSARLDHSETHLELEASKAKASQAKEELLRGELAAVCEKVLHLQGNINNANVALGQSEARYAEVLADLEASRKATAESRKEMEELRMKCDKLEKDNSDSTSKDQAEVRAAKEKADSLDVELQVTRLELAEAQVANKTLGKTVESKQVGKGLSASSWASGDDKPLDTVEVKRLKMTINELQKKNTELEAIRVNQGQMLDNSYKLASELGRDNYYLKDRMGNTALSPKARPYGSSNPYLGASSASAALPGSQANTLQPPRAQIPNLLYAQQQQPPLPPPQPIPQQNPQHQFPHLPLVPPNIQHQPPNMPHAQHQHQHQHHYQPGPQHQPPNILSARQQQEQQQHQPRPEAPAFVPYRAPPRIMPSRQNRGHQEGGTIDPANPGLIIKKW